MSKFILTVCVCLLGISVAAAETQSEVLAGKHGIAYSREVTRTSDKINLYGKSTKKSSFVEFCEKTGSRCEVRCPMPPNNSRSCFEYTDGRLECYCNGQLVLSDTTSDATKFGGRYIAAISILIFIARML